jgi:protein Tex
MFEQEIPSVIAQELGVRKNQVESTISLLDDGNTIPFIARYRKEATGELNEEQLRTIEERLAYLRNFVKRQNEILGSIEEQGKLTPELKTAILQATKMQTLEDLYLPFRPKKRTRASIAREKGLEPLALQILAQQQQSGDPMDFAAAFVNMDSGVGTPSDALSGAQDIIAEQVSEDANIRALIRSLLWQKSAIETLLVEDAKDAKEFLMYTEYREEVRRMPSHRILAVNRGENKECLKVKLAAPHEECVDHMTRKIITTSSIWKPTIQSAIEDGYKRLLFPSLERELRTELTARAETQAIKVFGLNLRQLLLQPPFPNQIILGLDPGYRTGCKVAVVDDLGRVLHTAAWYLTAASDHQIAQARTLALDVIRRYGVTLVAIGNGTASYETEEFVAALIREHNLAVSYIIVNEAGASVYSASKLAKEEMPDLDVSLRGAVSIARRIQDPLAELVKIDPKSIGVGQYQHDVEQKQLGHTLEGVVESCVNHVGVELNSASAELLSYVAGISSAVAKNIVSYRETNGTFITRAVLKKVPRLGPAAYTQAAGFLRILKSSNPLDNTPVHPESYALAEQILAKAGFTLSDLQDKDRVQQLRETVTNIDAAMLAQDLAAGVPTVRDILSALAKPGRDPREEMPRPLTRKNLTTLADIQAGMVLKGTVRNVVDFGVFVDIGIKVNGLIHRSELTTKPIKHPLDVVSVGDIIDVMVLSVDAERNRIALSLKAVNQ